MHAIYLRQVRRRLAIRLRNRRLAEGFRSNQELSEAIYQDQSVRISAKLLTSIERGRTDCPIDILWILAEFYRVSIPQRLAMQYEAIMGMN